MVYLQERWSSAFIYVIQYNTDYSIFLKKLKSEMYDVLQTFFEKLVFTGRDITLVSLSWEFLIHFCYFCQKLLNQFFYVPRNSDDVV